MFNSLRISTVHDHDNCHRARSLSFQRYTNLYTLHVRNSIQRFVISEVYRVCIGNAPALWILLAKRKFEKLMYATWCFENFREANNIHRARAKNSALTGLYHSQKWSLLYLKRIVPHLILLCSRFCIWTVCMRISNYSVFSNCIWSRFQSITVDLLFIFYWYTSVQ